MKKSIFHICIQPHQLAKENITNSNHIEYELKNVEAGNTIIAKNYKVYYDAYDIGRVKFAVGKK